MIHIFTELVPVQGVKGEHEIAIVGCSDAAARLTTGDWERAAGGWGTVEVLCGA